MNDLIETLRDTHVGNTIHYDGRVFYVVDVMPSEKVPGFVALDVRDANTDIRIRMSKAEARGLQRARYVRTIGDLADIVLGDTNFDGAVPQQFFEDSGCAKFFVWAYDESARVMGRPQPLTREAYQALLVYDDEHGSNYADHADFPPETVIVDDRRYVIG